MSFFRRNSPRYPQPADFNSAEEWLDALLATGMDGVEARRRLQDELARQARLQQQAEAERYVHDLAQREAAGRAAAVEKLLAETGLDESWPTPTPMNRPSDAIRGRPLW